MAHIIKCRGALNRLWRDIRPPAVSRQFPFSFVTVESGESSDSVVVQIDRLHFGNERIAMPTTIRIIHDSAARAARDVPKSRTGRILALGHRAWSELRKILASNDFKTVAIFSAVGLLIGLIAMLFGVQGVWM
jgi:hypothetical protein